MTRIARLSFVAMLMLASSALAAPSGMVTVATNADLKAATPVNAPPYSTYLRRAGYYASGDGGDAIYVWNAASSCVDDGGSCIVPNSAPTTGRWILNQDGDVSVKVFGAVCNGSADDTPMFAAALAARTGVFVPSNTMCSVALHTSADGLVMHDGNRLYGQNQFTSQIRINTYFTPSYDFVAGHRFTNIVVASNVGTVTTFWSHRLAVGNSITIAGSATAALNGTYSITAITAPDKFTITTSGVPNGTYTNPTSLVGPSGIGTAVVRSFGRDTGGGTDFIGFELDHLAFSIVSGLIPMTWIDLTGVRAARVHNLTFTGDQTSSGSVGFVCADNAPNNTPKSCFFNHVYDVSGRFGTMMHMSANTSDVGTNLFEQFSGTSRVMIDSTGSTQNMFGGVFTQWYVSSDGDTNSWDMYNTVLGGTAFIAISCEGCGHYANIHAGFAVVPATTNLFVDLPGIVIRLPAAVAGLPACNANMSGAFYAVYDAVSPSYNAPLTGGGSTVVPVFCNGTNWVAH